MFKHHLVGRGLEGRRIVVRLCEEERRCLWHNLTRRCKSESSGSLRVNCGGTATRRGRTASRAKTRSQIGFSVSQPMR